MTECRRRIGRCFLVFLINKNMCLDQSGIVLGENRCKTRLQSGESKKRIKLKEKRRVGDTQEESVIHKKSR